MRSLTVHACCICVLIGPCARANTFNVTAYGAKADGKTDCTQAIQKAVEDASAAARHYKEGQGGGSVVFFPSAPLPYMVRDPVFIQGSGVEVRGNGRGSILQSSSGSPALVFGKFDGGKSFEEAYRPDGFGVLDRAAAPRQGARRGIATRADASLIVPAHPLTFGYGYPKPDYWSSTSQLTLEFYLVRPRSAVWKPWSPILGMSGPEKLGLPWSVWLGDTPDVLVFGWRSNEVASIAVARQLIIPLDKKTRGWRITIQLDQKSGTARVWVNGATAAARVRDLDGLPFQAGQTFAEHDGFTQFLIGARGPAAPFQEKTTTDLELYGLRVARGLVYQMDAPTERFADDPKRPVNDMSRYFWNLGQVPNVQLVGLFPLDDLGATRTVRVLDDGHEASAFWVNAKTADLPIFCAIRDIQVRGRLQPAILLGQLFHFTAARVTAEYGYQGIGSLNLGANYTITLENCNLAGYDSAYYGYQQIIRARNTYILNGGRETVRLRGCSSTWDQTLVAFLLPHARIGFHFVLDEYGGQNRLTDLYFDNETTTFSRAAIEADQAANGAGWLIIDGLNLADCGKDAAILRLNGFGLEGEFKKNYLDLRAVACPPNYRAALEVQGKGWHGRFNAAQLEKAPILGDAASKIVVTPPTDAR